MMTEQEIQEMADLIEHWFNDPLAFFREALGVKPTNQQEQFGRHFRNMVLAKHYKKMLSHADALDNKEEQAALRKRYAYVNKHMKEYARRSGLSIMSGKGTGKDAVLSWTILWALICLNPVKVVCVAPSEVQLKTVLWQEARKWLDKRDPYTGEYMCVIRDYIEITASEMYLRDPDTKQRVTTSMAFGRTAVVEKDGSTKTLDGCHEEHMIIIADEAANIGDAVFGALDNTMTDPFNFCVVVFNPTRQHGFAIDTQFGKMKGYYVRLHWDCEKSSRITQDHIDRMCELYGGKGTDGYRIFINGLPPLSEGGSFISWALIDQCRRIPYFETQEHCEGVMGVDPAVLHDEAMVVYKMGPNIEKIEGIAKIEFKSDEELLGKVLIERMRQNGYRIMVVETNGLGHSVYKSALRRANEDEFIIGINTDTKPYNEEVYSLRRDELWANVRWMLQKGLLKLPPDDDKLHTELSAPMEKKGPQFKGKIKIENNVEIKLKIKRSPDRASALVMACAEDEEPYRLKPKDPYFDDYDSQYAAGPLGRGSYMSS